jgi:hypothetical protein
MSMKSLKWTKSDWQKDQQVGQKDWAKQIDNGPKDVADLLDLVHKKGLPLKKKQEEKLKALRELAGILDDYTVFVANDREALKTVTTRRDQVVKAAKRKDQEIKYTFSKLKLEVIFSNSTILAAFHEFCKKEFSLENLVFIMAVDTNRSPVYIQETFIGSKAKRQVNLCDANLAAAQQGDFKPAREEIFNLLRRDTLPRFLRSPELAAAVEKLSVIP